MQGFFSLRSDLLVREQWIKAGHGENFSGCWLSILGMCSFKANSLQQMYLLFRLDMTFYCVILNLCSSVNNVKHVLFLYMHTSVLPNTQ